MHIRGVILEGYSNAGKTSVLKAIKQYHSQDEFAERSIVVLGEHYSQILNNNHGKYISLTEDEHIHLLQERVELLKKLNEWAVHLGPASRSSRGLFYVLERFHLNHRAAFSESRNNRITELEEQLASLGARCILLTISPELAKDRIKSRERSRWINKTDEDIQLSINDLLSTQTILREQAKLSKVPTMEINTDNKDWSRYAKMIMEDSNF